MGQIKVELQEWMGSDRSIAEAAWTSSTTLAGKEKRTDEDVTRVVKQLIEQKHASPIESVVMRFWIKMPIQTDRQHMTHRVASHNGMSGRYRTMPDEWLHVPLDVEKIMFEAQDSSLIDRYEDLCEEVNDFYRYCLEFLKSSKEGEQISGDDYKRAREFFRGVLPQNNMTERVTVMNLRSFANYQKLRNTEYAQPEIRQVAQFMLQCIEEKNVCPITIQALKEQKWEI